MTHYEKPDIWTEQWRSDFLITMNVPNCGEKMQLVEYKEFIFTNDDNFVRSDFLINGCVNRMLGKGY